MSRGAPWLILTLGVCISSVGSQRRGLPRGYPGRCPNDCSGHGECRGFTEVYYPPVCVCEAGYEGTDCSMKICPNRCSDKGECDTETGICDCVKPFTGPSCQQKRCPSGALAKGPDMTCEGKLKATTKDLNFIKPKIPCPRNCSDHGRCEPTTGQCLCHWGWRGKDCSKSPCKDDCNGHGYCHISKPADNDYNWFGGKCICDDNYFGEFCQIHPEPCPKNCSGRGDCLHLEGPTGPGKCKCFTPWQGADCSYANGCIPGYHGSMPGCKNDCSCHGLCVGGFCKCEPGYAGDDCAVEIPMG